MPRTYKPRPKITRPCACGCGRTVTGRADRLYYNQSCRVRVMRRRRSHNPEALDFDAGVVSSALAPGSG